MQRPASSCCVMVSFAVKPSLFQAAPCRALLQAAARDQVSTVKGIISGIPYVHLLWVYKPSHTASCQQSCTLSYARFHSSRAQAILQRSATMCTTKPNSNTRGTCKALPVSNRGRGLNDCDRAQSFPSDCKGPHGVHSQGTLWIGMIAVLLRGPHGHDCKGGGG